LQRYGVLEAAVPPEEVYTNAIWEAATSK